jgi:hypothetical protein
MVNPQNPGTLALSRFVEGLGPSHGVVMVRAPVRNIADIESALALFGEGIDRAIIVLPDDLFVDNRDLTQPDVCSGIFASVLSAVSDEVVASRQRNQRRPK